MPTIRRIARFTLPVALILTLAGCSKEEETASAGASLRPVKVIEISSVSRGRELEYSGTVKARSEAATGFRVSGKITERLVDIGDRVSAGDILARLDVTDYELQMRSAKANLDAADRQLETAQFALKRTETLFQQQVTTKAQLEQAQLAYNQANASRDAALAGLNQASNQVEYGALKADRSAIVTAIHADAGQVVAAGSPVVNLAADGEKEVLIAVPETDILAFSTGKTVSVDFWSSNDLSLNGTVREVAGSADIASRTFAVRISLPDNPKILLGMTARVTARTDDPAQLVEIPLSALARDADKQPLVWLFDRDTEKVRSRAVKISAFSDSGVLISSGIKPGDVVVAAGTQFMSEELKVRLAAADTPLVANAKAAATQ